MLKPSRSSRKSVIEGNAVVPGPVAKDGAALVAELQCRLDERWGVVNEEAPSGLKP